MRTALRGKLVRVDQPAEEVAAANAFEVDHLDQWMLTVERRPLPKRPLRPMSVEVPDIRDEHVLEVAAADDQQPVEALAANASDPPRFARRRND